MVDNDLPITGPGVHYATVPYPFDTIVAPTKITVFI